MSPHCHDNKSWHHKVPQSRGGWPRDNRGLIDQRLHDAWHEGFDVDIPPEACRRILDWWPKPSVTWVDLFHRRRRIHLYPGWHRSPPSGRVLRGMQTVFPLHNQFEVLQVWLWRWVPMDYFDHIQVCVGRDAHWVDPSIRDVELLQRVDRLHQRRLPEIPNRRPVPTSTPAPRLA